MVVPSGVQVKFDSGVLTAKGPKGELKEAVHPYVKVAIKDGQIVLTTDISVARDASAIWGMTRARLNNLVHGVASGYTKNLEVRGLAFRADVAGQKLTMALGKSRPIIFEAPKEITLSVDAKKTLITVSGVSKDFVGEIAAKIRGFYKPAAYKGKGIRYQGEYVREKPTKQAAGASAGTGGKK
jgi:large subunit ribosomal protein L6